MSTSCSPWNFSGRGDSDFASLKDKARHADDIADVHALKFLIGFLAQVISGYVDLNAAFLVLNVAERSLAHDALEHHAAGDGNGLVFKLIKVLFDLLAVIGLVELDDLKRIFSRCLKLCEFLSSYLLELRSILYLLLIILCHFYLHVEALSAETREENFAKANSPMRSCKV